VRYLVTGGAGFIGSALTRRLLADGHEVNVLDDYSRGKRSRLPHQAGLQVFQGDIRNTAAVTQAMHGCDSVVHMAYMQGTQTFYSEPRAVLDVALRGILNVLDACAVTGCGELLMVSSSEAYQVASKVPTPEDVPLVVPDPLNPRYSYGGGKIACELAALAWQRAGVLDRVIIARPHNIYGPDMGREHVIPEFCLRMNAIIAEASAPGNMMDSPVPFPIQGTGEETRSFCYVDDCTAQLALLLSSVRAVTPHGAEIYHVGTMDEHTIADVAHQVAACYGRKIKIEPGTLPQGSPPRRLPDMRKMTRLQGGITRPVSFADGLAATVKWYRVNG
jgi:dTDP-glucose 4,6-dehydratase/UDP-glucose 4-epimerase